MIKRIGPIFGFSGYAVLERGNSRNPALVSDFDLCTDAGAEMGMLERGDSSQGGALEKTSSLVLGILTWAF